MKLLLFFSLSLLVGATTSAATAGTPVEASRIDREKELIIRDLAVVENWCGTKPGDGGPFTLEHLLAGFSADRTNRATRTALLDWLNSWTTQTSLGPVDVGRRLIKQWKRDDGMAGRPDHEWEPNFAHSPFRLLAIVNRLDLQRRDAEGRPLNAGEGRFVFGVTLGPAASPASTVLQATVIFEYELPATDEDGVYAWAKSWHDLGSHLVIDKEYCKELATLTERFTRRDAMPGKTNGSALNRIRTNEQNLSAGTELGGLGGVWRLQEFVLDGTSKRFIGTLTKQTPPTDLAQSQLLADYINAEEAAVLRQKHEVKSPYQGVQFLAQQSVIPDASRAIWAPLDVDGNLLVKNPLARFYFAFNTCNGCHGAETETVFSHIQPRPKDEPSELSRFLEDKPPPGAWRGDRHRPELKQLKEITLRQQIMADILNGQRPENRFWRIKRLFSDPPKPSRHLLSLIAARANREH